MATFTTDLGKILNKLTVDEPLSSTQSFYVEQKVKLWENPSRTSSFPTQSVSLALSDYGAVEIVLLMYTNSGVEFYQNYLCSNDIDSVFSCIIHGTTQMVTRTCDVSNTAVSFSSGYVNGGINDEAAIPYQIYGIKGVGGGGITPYYSIYLILFSKKKERRY